MKEIYKQIWELAKPYYKKGRPMDIAHIEWMMGDTYKLCTSEGLDDSLLLPLVILHDVGYAEVPKGNPYLKSLRKAHMKAGAVIARRVLEKVKYPSDKIDKISYYVSVHDNWALGDYSVYKDKVLGVFADLDFLWMATPKGFPALQKILKKDAKEMYVYLRDREKHEQRRFAIPATKKLFEKYMRDRKKEV